MSEANEVPSAALAPDLSITTLVFDVLGTLLDEEAAYAAAAAEAALDVSGADPVALGRQWSLRLSSAIDAVHDDHLPFETIDVLGRQTLAETLAEHHVSVAEDRLTWLAQVGHRLAPFPDVTDAFDSLARSRALIALTNAGIAQAFDMFTNAGLRWNFVVSAEMVQAYKPDPRMYTYAIDRLHLDRNRTLFVAAHPWDLDAAAGHGLRTAYIDRAARPPDCLAAYSKRFDLVLPDLGSLVGVLNAAT